MVAIANGDVGSLVRSRVNLLLATAIANGDIAASVYSKVNGIITGPTSDWGAARAKLNALFPVLTISGPASVTEGSGGGTTVVTYTASVARGLINGALTVNWTITGTGSNPADASDFTSMSGSVTIPAGQTSATLTIGIVKDSAIEPNEGYRVTGVLAALPWINGSSDGSILNDDAPDSGDVAIQTNGVTYNAVTRETRFPVNRTGDTSSQKTWNWKVVPTALSGRVPTTAGGDFGGTNPNGTIFWPIGDTSTKYISVTPTSDAVPE